MKIKNKGKVYPSPSSSSSSTASSVSTTTERDVFSALKLLPATILALASVLSIDDREVLAYMITRSLKTCTSAPSSLAQDSKRKSSRKSPANNICGSHKGAPIFDCDCFDCYTSYWFRWDSSSNRELIHQAIEAYEEHLTTGEQSRKNTRAKRRDKMGRRVGEKPVLEAEHPFHESPPPKTDEPPVIVVGLPSDDDVSVPGTSEKVADAKGGVLLNAGDELVGDMPADDAVETVQMALVLGTPPATMNSHRGLARKVLPDVLGLLNSRLWNLWGPNV